MTKQKQTVPPFILFTAAIFICFLSHLTVALAGGFSIRDSINGSSSPTWCTAKPGTPDAELATALNWVCAQPGIDCAPVQQNGPCFYPDNYVAHSSYAFNLYYQMRGHASGSCDFGASAVIVQTDPSTASCTYSGGNASNQVTSPSSPTGSIAHGPFSHGSSPAGSFDNSTYTNAAICLSGRFRLIAPIAIFINVILLWPALAAL